MPLLLTFVSRAQPTHVLDVTKLVVPEYPSGPPKARGAGGTGIFLTSDIPPVKDPLRISLERLDRQSYKRGDELVYTLSIENVGSKPISLPWTRDWRLVEPGGPTDCLSIMLSLTAVTQGYDDELFAPVPLYGAPSIPNSVRALLPGETARLIVPSKVTIDHPRLLNALSKGTRPQTTLSARVIFLRGWHDIPRDTATSKNVLATTLEGKN